MLALISCTAPLIPLSDKALPEVGEVETELLGEPGLILSEVQVENESTLQDEQGELFDWVELENVSGESIELAGWILKGSKEEWEGEGTLEAGEFKLVALSLENEGEQLLLSGPESAEYLALGNNPADTSWARFGEVWEFTVLPTPGRANGSFPVQGKDAGDAVFQDRWVSQIDLQLSQASLASLATDPYQEVPGSIGYGTVWFPSVGIHLKGGWGSLRTLQEKAGFKVDLNEYETHHIAGQKMLTLNSMVQDPTFLHEYLAYTVYRELQLPAPRTGWVYVTVNGTYYGIYLWVETIDDWFLDAWWDSPDGALYEGAYGVDLTTGAEFAFEYDGGPNPDDRSELTELIALLNVEPSEEVLVNLESRLDVDQVLLVLAVEAGTLHWDGYTTKNNYRLYHDPVTKQFSMIPWGTDQTWVDWWYGPYDGQGHFFQWCLAIESCKVRYNDALLKVADVLEALPLLSMLNQSYAWIEPIIKEEPFYEHGDESRADFLERTIETITIMPDYLREQVQAAQ